MASSIFRMDFDETILMICRRDIKYINVINLFNFIFFVFCIIKK